MARAPITILLVCSFALMALGDKKADKAFLKANKKRDGVVSLKSGLQYKVLTEGTGNRVPQRQTIVEVNFNMTTLALTPEVIDKEPDEWTMADSSYKFKRTAKYVAKDRIKGWRQAMYQMVKGDIWELYIPQDIAYGEEGLMDTVKPYEMIILRLEIIDFEGKTDNAAKCDLKTRENCNDGQKELLDKWAKKSLEEVTAAEEALQTRKKDVLKEGEREKVIADLKTVRDIRKAKAKGEEL